MHEFFQLSYVSLKIFFPSHEKNLKKKKTRMYGLEYCKSNKHMKEVFNKLVKAILWEKQQVLKMEREKLAREELFFLFAVYLSLLS